MPNTDAEVAATALAGVLETMDRQIAELETLLLSHEATLAERARASDEWTAAQVADHLLRVHAGALKACSEWKPMPRRAPSLAMKRRIVRWILRRGIRVPVKGAFPEVAPDAELAPLLERIAQLHRTLKKKLSRADDLTLQMLIHPVAGPLSVEESVDFVSGHLEYHLIQLRGLAKGR